MGKREKARWERFGDLHACGNSIPRNGFGRKLIAKWQKAGLIRPVDWREDSVSFDPNGTLTEWNLGEYVATAKGLKFL